ncbi:energy-coupling factor transporter transmembrane protein EcfT [Crossiella equi]|uniref:Energy-coupling factor transporter transmembrane protein EcfT n=1 Tax=Crossiella equi TaxID=130796 RepID=A0ABS5A5J0_9PSEU|nr:VanZ family protein [Crossiella equi]MBP2471856.1 energy-coupling factor transporter transmembrane protein EcfT [Crossiella equi]
MLEQVWITVGVAWGALSNPLIAGGVVVGAVVLGFGARWAARRFGWRPTPSVLAGLFLGVVLGVTFSRVPPAWTQAAGQPFCNVSGFSLHGANEALNALLFVPLVVCAVLATRRPVAVAVSAAALSALVELLQPLTGRGICETQDFLNNTAGAVVAACVTAAVLAFQRRGARVPG